jgi:hypothetical protein
VRLPLSIGCISVNLWLIGVGLGATLYIQFLFYYYYYIILVSFFRSHRSQCPSNFGCL